MDAVFSVFSENQWDGAEAEVCKSLILPSSIKILTGRHYEVIDLMTVRAECHSKDRGNFLGSCKVSKLHAL